MARHDHNSVSSTDTTTNTAPLALATRALRAGRQGGRGDALVGGIVQSTTFLQDGDDVGSPVEFAYSRCSNPTVSELERALAELEGAEACVTFSTGLGAETALMLALLSAGDHVILGSAIYGGTTRLVQQVLSKFGVEHTFVDARDAENVQRALRPRTKLVFIESPANPTLVLTDIEAVAKVTRQAGAILAVDNTFLTAIVQRPLDLGADVSVYSTTKHIEGHSTALGGALVTSNPELAEKLRFIRKSTGGIQSPLNAWLTTRGIRTLALRIREQSKNALRIARWLSTHDDVAKVHYPGLERFPQRALALKQHIGDLHGGVVSFELRGGVPAGREFLRSLELCSLVEHVGSVETLVTHPATMTHGDVPRHQREAVGITDGLVRLSVGLEDTVDVIADLDQAITRAHAATPTPTRTKVERAGTDTAATLTPALAK